MTKIFSTQGKVKQESFTYLMRSDPNVLKNLLTQLKEENVWRASEILVTILSVCEVFCVPDWIQQSSSEEELFALCDQVLVNQPTFPFPPPSTLDNFWFGYQEVIKNYESFIVRDLMHKLRCIHGEILVKIDLSLVHEDELKKVNQWGAEVIKCLKQEFEAHLLEYTELLRSLLYQSLQHKREIKFTLFSSNPIQYRVEFNTRNRRRDKIMFFCLTSYIKLPKLLHVPRSYHNSGIDPGGVVCFKPFQCEYCDSKIFGMRHFSVLSQFSQEELSYKSM